ncbi:MAG: hypothetical protein K0U74_00830 [Alphaproteobacteria bacterium]|nr:hypothetical protein [Alphaproteobacteria bacterium]
MAAVEAEFSATEAGAQALPLRRILFLVRIACANGATRAQIVRDFSPLFSHKLSPAELRQAALDDVDALECDGLITSARGRFAVTDEGREAADRFLSRKGASAGAWPEVRDGRLVAKGLGLEAIGPKKLKSLLTPDGLRAFILQQTYGLSPAGTQTTAKLRAQLAVVALERAFGNKIKTGLGAGSGFSAKAGRLLAGQLSSRPRDLGSDGRLVATLAAEAVDARQNDADALRIAILRRLAESALNEPKAKSPAKVRTSALAAPAAKPVAANDAGLPGAALPPTRRPDPAAFARDVQVAARTCAEGWAGNRKALIARVWKAVEGAHPDWGLSEIEFKCMLGEAHRTGHLRLATADLKDQKSAEEIEASAITYKNTQWHLIRVVEPD